MILTRDRDDTNGLHPTGSTDGTLEERRYLCQNWRADVVAIVTDTAQMVEWDKYSSYGVPFGLPAGDADSDADCNSTVSKSSPPKGRRWF
ncbi:MAG: hypothetical protein ACF8PN_17600 [Phycisphaerales bacterium]